MMRSLFLFCFCVLLRCADSFSVDVPSEPVLVARGSTALLSCLFEPDVDLNNMVITWQREEDDRVVHSFYYNIDQLGRQSPEYVNRTKLDVKELLKGNASLSISDFRLGDAGKYLCIVIGPKGNAKGKIQLVYTVFYSEPRLSIHLNSSDVIVQYETEGYPEPEVRWQGSGGQNISNQQEVSTASGGGLYHLKSRVVTQSPELNITFTLKNPVTHQELQRHVILNYDGNSSSSALVVVLSIFCVVLLCSTGSLLYLHCYDKRK